MRYKREMAGAGLGDKMYSYRKKPEKKTRRWKSAADENMEDTQQVFAAGDEEVAAGLAAAIAAQLKPPSYLAEGAAPSSGKSPLPPDGVNLASIKNAVVKLNLAV